MYSENSVRDIEDLRKTNYRPESGRERETGAIQNRPRQIIFNIEILAICSENFKCKNLLNTVKLYVSILLRPRR